MFSKKDENGLPIRTKVVLVCGDGLTKQSHKKECDINQIMSNYQKTGTVAFRNAREAEYMDVPVLDFHSALNLVKQAETTFSEMPSHLRKKFRNDPGEFMDFIHNADNLDESIELGLLEPPADYIKPAQRVAQPPAEPPPEGAA